MGCKPSVIATSHQERQGTNCSHQPSDQTDVTVAKIKQTDTAIISDPSRSYEGPSKSSDPPNDPSDPSICGVERTEPEITVVSMNIPEVDKTREMKDYTMYDLTNDKTLFKYGRKVYSNAIMQSIIKIRLDQFAEVTGIPHWRRKRHPVENALMKWVRREEMGRILPVCLIGHFVDLPRDEFSSWMKQNVKLILEEGNVDRNGLSDYKQQLLRWLDKYPGVVSDNTLSDYKTDPNSLRFPIMIDDPTDFRKWLEDWQVFDTDVPESGAWKFYECEPIYNPDLSEQFHNLYASLITRDDDSIEDFDMAIDGEAAWFVIEQDIVRNDKATETQLRVWSNRANRTNINDLHWMDKRRRKLADTLTKRHKWEADFVIPYMTFADRIDKGWQEFIELCNNPYDPPEKYKKLYIATEN